MIRRSGRCEPYQEDVVAVSDGVLMRDPGDRCALSGRRQARRAHPLPLSAHEPADAGRRRHGHRPRRRRRRSARRRRQLRQHGTAAPAIICTSTRRCRRAHGWVFINPYMTLVAAYERLIGGRGQVVNDAMFAPPPSRPTACCRRSCQSRHGRTIKACRNTQIVHVRCYRTAEDGISSKQTGQD